MARGARFLFGMLAYVFFLGVFLYLIGFVSNEIVPRSIAVGPVSHFLPALIVDLLLIVQFHTMIVINWTQIV